MPQGRSRFTFIYARSGSVSAQYDPGGNVESITAPYNFELDTSKISSFLGAVAVLQSYLDNLGYYYHVQNSNNPLTVIDKNPANGVLLGDAISRGFLNVNADDVQQQFAVSYNYGVTDHLSVGFGLPLVHNGVSFGAGITGDNSAQAAYSFFNSGSLIPSSLLSSLQLLATANTSTLQSLLAARGYNAVQSYSGDYLGDLRFGARYNYFDKPVDKLGQVISSFQLGMMFPTGHIRDPANVTEPSTGQGCFQLMADHIVNIKPFDGLMLSNGLHYLHPFPAHDTQRVDSSPSDIIPDASDQQDVWFHLGDTYSIDFGAKYSFNSVFSFEAMYWWSWHMTDYYNGTRPIDYTYLSLNTLTYLETIELQLGASSVASFLNKGFPIPGDISFLVVIPRTGRNTYVSPYGEADFSLYF